MDGNVQICGRIYAEAQRPHEGARVGKAQLYRRQFQQNITKNAYFATFLKCAKTQF